MNPMTLPIIMPLKLRLKLQELHESARMRLLDALSAVDADAASDMICELEGQVADALESASQWQQRYDGLRGEMRGGL